jgi:coupling of ubiquitin conjugation to ER degradation protein 1
VSSSSASTAENKPATPKPSQPDLITRYNLSAKVASADHDAEEAESTGTSGGKSAWSVNKSERQALLQKRREEMILAARRKMQAKLAAEAVQGDGGMGQT